MNSKFEKITFLINSLGGGGAEGVCVTLANSLIEKDWSVDLIVLHLDNAINQEKLNPKVNLINLNTKNARKSFVLLLKYILRIEPNKVLVFNQQLAVLLILIKYMTFLRFKIIARNINTLSEAQKNQKSFWHKYIVHFIVKFLYNKVDKIIAQSIGMKNDLCANFGFKSKQVIVVNNPLNQEIERFDTNNFKLVEKQDYILCVGRLEKQKAFHYAIKAFAKISLDFPLLRLKIIGIGTLEKELRKLSEDLNIAEKIDFEGFQRNVIPYYLYAKATMLTSLYEGFPNVLIESIALGTPVVAFDCPSGPKEIIEDGINGYLVEYLNEEESVAKLKKVLMTNFNLEKLKATINKYNQENIISKYIGILS